MFATTPTLASVQNQLTTEEIRSLEIPTLNLNMKALLVAGSINGDFRLRLVEYNENHLRVQILDPIKVEQFLSDGNLESLFNPFKRFELLNAWTCKQAIFCSRFSGDISGRSLGLGLLNQSIFEITKDPNGISLDSLPFLDRINWRKNDIAIRLGKLGVYDFPIVQMPDPRLMDLRNKPFIITLTPGSKNHYTLSIGVTHGSMILATTSSYAQLIESQEITKSNVIIDGYIEVNNKFGYLNARIRGFVGEGEAHWRNAAAIIGNHLTCFGFTKFTVALPDSSSYSFLGSVNYKELKGT